MSQPERKFGFEVVACFELFVDPSSQFPTVKCDLYADDTFYTQTNEDGDVGLFVETERDFFEQVCLLTPQDFMTILDNCKRVSMEDV